MNGVHVTAHAIERYRERVADIPEAEVRVRLSSDTFRKAAEIGATAVILPTGHKAIIEDGCVVTIHPKRAKRRRMREVEE